MRQTNYREGYSIEQHALEMFRENYKTFSLKEKEFDIRPYSEAYYKNNIDCFRDRDGLEIGMMISELVSKKLLRLHEKAHNIVVITERGKEELSSWKTHLDRVFG